MRNLKVVCLLTLIGLTVAVCVNGCSSSSSSPASTAPTFKVKSSTSAT